MDATFARAGSDVRLDPGARVLRPDLVSVGSHVRIDAGVIISGDHPVTIGDHVHLAAGVKISTSGGPVTLGDLTTLSGDVKVYTASDDYTGGSLTNPTVPLRFKDLTVGPVVLEEHVLVGAGSVLLPATVLRYGAAAGALSLVRGEVPPGTLVAGCPARPIGRRDVDRLRRLATQLRAEESSGPGAA